MSMVDLDHHLAKVASAAQEFKRLDSGVEFKHPVHYGVNPVLLVEPQHVLELILGPIQNPFERDGAPQRQHIDVCPVVGPVRFPRNVPNAVDEAAKRDTLEALLKSACTAYLEDDVGAMAAGGLHDNVLPVWICNVVDQDVGAKLLRLAQLIVGGRGHNN